MRGCGAPLACPPDAGRLAMRPGLAARLDLVNHPVINQIVRGTFETRQMPALVISGVALLVAIIALWRNQLSPGRIQAVAGALRLHVHPYEKKGVHWVVPALHLTVNFTNAGAKPTTVEAIRIRMSYLDIQPEGNFEEFNPVVVPQEQPGPKRDDPKRRDERLGQESEWVPVVVLPGESSTRHIICQALAWDNPPLGRANATLEVKVTGKDWKAVEGWKFDLDGGMWHYLYGGTSFPGYKEPGPRLDALYEPPNLPELIGRNAVAKIGPAPFDVFRAKFRKRQRSLGIDEPADDPQA
jgi:hypothetical protein